MARTKYSEEVINCTIKLYNDGETTTLIGQKRKCLILKNDSLKRAKS